MHKVIRIIFTAGAAANKTCRISTDLAILYLVNQQSGILLWPKKGGVGEKEQELPVCQ